MTDANEIQIGGDHYKKHGTGKLQHWDLVILNGLDYFQGNITKYLFRWKNKNGLQDLQKAGHYLDKYMQELKFATRYTPPNYKWIEDIGEDRRNWPMPLWEVTSHFELDYFQSRITDCVLAWPEHGISELSRARVLLNEYMGISEPKKPVLSAELDAAVRKIEWDNSEEPEETLYATDSNLHPAEHPLAVEGRAGSIADADCILCGAKKGGHHRLDCDRNVMPPLVYRGPDLPMLRAGQGQPGPAGGSQ